MDDGFGLIGFAANFSSVFGNLISFRNGSVHRADTTLRLSSQGSYDVESKGIKRKWGAANGEDNIKDASSLILGLGSSLSSSGNSKMSLATGCSMSSAKEALEEESSGGLGLNFHLHLGNKSMPGTERCSRATPAAMEKMGPFSDLQLSLSMAPSQSVITSASPDSAQCHNCLDASMNIGAAALVDDGSTSSRWKPEGSFFTPFKSADTNESSSTWQMPKPKPLSTSTIMPKSPVACSSGVTQQRASNAKICKFRGCERGARGASGLCIAHGGGRRCQREGCNKGAEGRTVYCKAHGGGRRCQYLGCTKSAEGRTEHCIAHGGGRRCSHEGCTKAARGKSGLCIKHGGGKRCQRENCAKSAEGHSGFCISHGGGRRCQFPACSKGAQGSTMYCKAHGGGRRCTAPGCTKGAEGSTPFCKGHGGGKRCSFQGGGVCSKSVHGGTHFCVAHGGGKRCAAPGCTRSARGRTDFCVRHGGGKRCKFEGCGKSAQGRTDFCKAHGGGGRRCSWAPEVSANGAPRGRSARGKPGLLLSESRVHGGGKLGTAAAPSQDLQRDGREGTEDVIVMASAGASKKDKNIGSRRNPFSHPQHGRPTALPEGRVHGGSVMAMLLAGSSTRIDSSGEDAEHHMLPLKWT